MIKFSPNIKQVEYQDNIFMQNISPNVLDLYEYLLIRKMKSLEEFNSIKLDIGHKKYLSMKFDNFLINKTLMNIDYKNESQ